ncbi:cubilin-like [Homalodisca vitripennis]|uniref:cubilin-like n=1 Tax=Homalodisca vitripennis TaxID=197043 RepID=UPI001EEBA52C|nr:cubilin-like [Homalodisca vitripennis]
MAIKFQSESFSFLRFQAAIGFTYGEKHNCGGTIHLANVSLPYLLQAPDVDGDGHYEPLLSCDWLFLAPDAHQIRASFNKLDIQNCSNCNCDVLKITDGEVDTDDSWTTMFCSSSLNGISWRRKSLLEAVFWSISLLMQLLNYLASSSPLLLSPSLCGPSTRHATRQLQVLQSPGMDGTLI